MDKNLISEHFWIFSHGGMTRRATETSVFRLSRWAADCLKIENLIKKYIFFLNIFFFSKTRIFKLKKI
jgi:hypothetical protein